MYEVNLKIPSEVAVEVVDNKVIVSGERGKLEREFKGIRGIKIEKIDSLIKVSSESERRKTKAIAGAIIAHVKNMINGLMKGYTTKLKVIYSHFPVTIKVEGGKVLIENFLGERVPRVAKIVSSTEVKVEKDMITLTGIDVEAVGQTAANLETATKISKRDRKIFQDGIFIVSKE